MGKGSKAFGKNATKFRLVHRSQRDPLAADPDAPQMVLVPMNDSDNGKDKRAKRQPRSAHKTQHTDDADAAHSDDGDAPEGLNPKQVELYHRKALAAEAGILFEDDYDYSQHLREGQQPEFEFIGADEKILREIAKTKGIPLSSLVAEAHGGLHLPESILPSAVEEEVGLLNRAAPTSSLPLDWDPEIVAALDGALEGDDPSNILDDDFILQANANPEDGEWEDDDEEWTDDDEDAEDDEEYDEGDVGSDDLNDSDLSFADDDDEDADPSMRIPNKFVSFKGVRKLGSGKPGLPEEAKSTKSVFTDYSMTSSILPRSELLQLQDDMFEKFFEDEYGEEQIGALEEDEVDADDRQVPANIQKIFNAHLSQLSTRRMIPSKADPSIAVRRPRYVKGKQVVPMAPLGELVETDQLIPVQVFPAEEHVDVEECIQDLYPTKQVAEFDCESILSTRSSAYNHPTKIQAPPPKPKHKPIQLNKQGIPLEAFEHRKARAGRADDQLDRPPTPTDDGTQDRCDGDSEQGSDDEDDEDFALAVNAGQARNKKETAEEKRARKKALKEERRHRREAKQQTKQAFKQEMQRQQAQQASARANLAII